MFLITVLLVVEKCGKLWNSTRFSLCNPACFIDHGVRSEASGIRTETATWIVLLLLYQSRDVEVACAGQVRLCMVRFNA